jgi:hypothetical protein
MTKHKIFLTCYDFDKKQPYFDEVAGVFRSKMEAENTMFHLAIDELACLNGITEDESFPERRFIATTEDEDYDLVINAWDGPDYRPVTCYNIMSEAKLLKMLNNMLRERHGKHITVKIKHYVDDDGTTKYYYTSRKYGDSIAFDMAVTAYYEANTYLNGVGELW